jgi:hypothetical protein
LIEYFTWTFILYVLLPFNTFIFLLNMLIYREHFLSVSSLDASGNFDLDPLFYHVARINTMGNKNMKIHIYTIDPI